MSDRRRFSSKRTRYIGKPEAAQAEGDSVNASDSDLKADGPDDSPSETSDQVYRPIVILEPHLDDFDLGDDSSDDGPAGGDDLIDRNGTVGVWRQSSTNLLLVGDVLAPAELTALQQLPKRTGAADLLSVESHGLRLGAVFKSGRHFLLALYSRSGQLGRTQRLKPHALQSIELKHQVDLNQDGHLGFRRTRLSGALVSAAESRVTIQPLQSFPAVVGADPAPLVHSLDVGEAGDHPYGVRPFTSAPALQA